MFNLLTRYKQLHERRQALHALRLLMSEGSDWAAEWHGRLYDNNDPKLWAEFWAEMAKIVDNIVSTLRASSLSVNEAYEAMSRLSEMLAVEQGSHERQ